MSLHSTSSICVFRKKQSNWKIENVRKGLNEKRLADRKKTSRTVEKEVKICSFIVAKKPKISTRSSASFTSRMLLLKQISMANQESMN